MNQQQLMDEAYDRWQNNDWTKQQFWNRLSFVERVAVFTGDLNYQVENGGFIQWMDNGYSDCSTELIAILEDNIGTETTKEVVILIKKALQQQEEYQCDYCDGDCYCESSYLEMNDLDNRFYEINEQFLADVEAFLTA